MTTVSVFGGTGFLGRRLVRRLASEGTAVRIAVRHPDKARTSLRVADMERVTLFCADVRDRAAVAGAVAAATAVLPPLVKHSSFPLPDSWGLALEIVAFAAAFLVLQRGRAWLLPWIASIALLSFVRDSTWIPIGSRVHDPCARPPRVARESVSRPN